MPALSVLVWIPTLAGVAATLLAGGERRSPRRAAGAIAFLGALAVFGLSIGYIVDWTPSARGLQHVTDIDWIPSLGIHYKLAITGLNVFMIALTTLLYAAAVLAANLRRWDRPRLFYFLLMLSESAVLGVFCAQDMALFYGFFDLMLIPFYMLMGTWGGRDRIRATMKLIIYTFCGSLLMLSAVVATGVLAAHGGHPDFTYSALEAHPLSLSSQEWIFLLFAFAFCVKMPLFPFHGWMPDTYRNMPIEVLTVFSGVLSKVGAYGFLVIVLPIYSRGSAHFQLLLLVVALCSIVYGSVMAFTQTQLRLIVGFSSVAQMGFITLGIFALDHQGVQGALLQMVNHGLVVAPLLFIVALLARRTGGSEDLRDMGGIATRAPVFASLFLIVALATLAMPGSGNFVGEFLILLGVFKTKEAVAIIAFTGVVMASVYALRMFIRTVHNRAGRDVATHEIALADASVLVPLVATIVFMAFYPQLELSRTQSSTRASVTRASLIARAPNAFTPASLRTPAAPKATATP